MRTTENTDQTFPWMAYYDGLMSLALYPITDENHPEVDEQKFLAFLAGFFKINDEAELRSKLKTEQEKGRLIVEQYSASEHQTILELFLGKKQLLDSTDSLPGFCPL